VELREKFEEATQAREAVARAAIGNGWSQKKEAWSRVLARVDELVERLRTWNIELRDINTGLVDFPSVVDGDEAYLCWRLGEPEVSYWHKRDEGFPGRRPL